MEATIHIRKKQRSFLRWKADLKAMESYLGAKEVQIAVVN